MANKTSYGLTKQLNSPYLKHWTKCMLNKTHLRLTHLEINVGPSQRTDMLESLKEEY